MIFQGIRTSISRKPYIFVIFQWGLDPLHPPSGSSHKSHRKCTNQVNCAKLHSFYILEMSCGCTNAFKYLNLYHFCTNGKSKFNKIVHYLFGSCHKFSDLANSVDPDEMPLFLFIYSFIYFRISFQKSPFKGFQCIIGFKFISM